MGRGPASRPRQPARHRSGVRFLHARQEVAVLGSTNSLRSVVLPAGIEPTSQASEARILSVELREGNPRHYTISIENMKIY